MTQQRGYYSDVINPDSERQLPAVDKKQMARAKKGDSLLKKAGSLQHTPDPLTFNVPPPDEFNKLLDRQKYGPSTALLGKSDYAKRAWDPKVQVSILSFSLSPSSYHYTHTGTVSRAEWTDSP